MKLCGKGLHDMDAPNGRRGCRCRLCQNAVCRKYNATDKGKAASRKYADTDNGKAANSKASRKSAAKRRRENPERVHAIVRKAALKGSRKRRAIKFSVIGDHFTSTEFEKLKAKYGSRCLACLRTETELTGLGRKLVPDHIVPLSLGRPRSDEITNIQPLCHGPGGCNNSKHATHADYRPTFRSRLRKQQAAAA